MPGTGVSAAPAGMQASGARFVQSYDVIVRYMQGLRNQLDQLRSEWDGDAAKIFDNTMTLWGKDFDNITSHLDKMADLLLGGAGHQERAEDLAIHDGKFL
jgi:WXG100 family type VII secretion target